MAVKIMVNVSLFLIILSAANNGITQTSFPMGDVTHDGLIDGRDALQIMRVVDNLDPLTTEILNLGDVFPFPGTDGRTWGDGLITQDDALKILRYTVGLAPEGELTGNFNQSAPRIDSFEPTFGVVGTRVTITGANFVEMAGVNQVWFGDAAARILQISNTEIQTEVPVGAKTSLIRVQNPGGTAFGKNEFVVTEIKEGVLVLDGGLRPGEFIITSGYSNTEDISENGGFSIAVGNERVNVMGAIPKGEGNHSYLALWLPDDASSGAIPPRRIDAASTARALVYLCPFFTSNNPDIARTVLAAMNSVAEVKALEEVIKQRYPQHAPGLEDPGLETAWEQAVIAVNNALPDALLMSLNASPSASAFSRSSTIQWNGKVSASANKFGMNMTPYVFTPFNVSPHSTTATNNTILLRVDCNFLGAVRSSSGRIQPELEMYSPIDWVAALYPLDVNDMPRGINEPLRELRKREVKTVGNSQATILAAKQWTANIDIVYTLVDKAVQSIADFAWPPDATFQLEEGDGVFALHGFSGVVHTASERDNEDYEVLSKIPKGWDNHYMAVAVNLAIAAIDTWELADQNAKTFQRSMVKAAIKNGIRKISQEYGTIQIESMTFKDWTRLLWSTYMEMEKAAFSTAITEAPELATKKMAKTFSDAGSKTHTLLAALGKIALVGKVSERIVGLAGYTFTVNPFFLLKPSNGIVGVYQGPRTLETIFIVKGDPFSPSVSSLDPTWGGRNFAVTLKGDRFARRAEDNKVSLQEAGQDDSSTIPAKVLEVNSNGSELKFQVPQLKKDQHYDVSVITPSALHEARAPDRFFYREVPILEAISPHSGFAAIPADSENPITGAGRWGTQVMLTVQDFSTQEIPAHQLIFGNLGEQTINRSGNISSYQYSFQVPPASPGTYPVFIRCPKHDNYETKKYDFIILPPPDLLTVEPETAMAGQNVQIIGFNFGTSTEFVRVQIGSQNIIPSLVEPNRITFNMPFFNESGVKHNLNVWTPSGQSNTKEIEFRLGGANYNPNPLPIGWTITVNHSASGKEPDGKLNLDEAAAFARGELNPFVAPWDDENIVEEIYYDETLRSDGTRVWVEKEKKQYKTPGGIGYEYRTVYGFYRYLDGRTEQVTQLRENLDLGENAEEGDFIQGSSSEIGGQYFRDQIQCALSEDVFAVDLTLGKNDDLTLSDSSILKLGGRGLTLVGDSRVRLATVDTPLDVAINLQGGSGNSIEVKGFMNCSRAAISAKDSWFNEIDIRIAGGNSDGVVIEGGGNNQITGLIENVNGNGLLLRNTVYNRVNNLTIHDSGNSGILIDGAQFNKFTQIDSFSNHNNGIRIENGKQNDFQHCSFRLNQSGGTLLGADCTENRFESCFFGSNEQKPQTGNRQHGIHIQNGASKNVLFDCVFNDNQEHGILLEGATTKSNEINGSQNDSLNIAYNNGKDGVLIRDGASENNFTRLQSYGNKENGITIVGPDTESNRIFNCRLGKRGYVNGQLTSFPNAGWGMVVRDEAYKTIIERCAFLFSPKGNLLIENMIQSWAEDDHPIEVNQCSFGFSVYVDENTIVRSFDELQVTVGNAIEMNQVHRALLFSNYYNSHIHSILMKDTEECILDTNHARNSRTYGLYMIRGKNNKICQLNARAPQHGFYAEDSHDCQVEFATLYGQRGSALFLESCRNFVVTDSTSWQSNIGVTVSNSTHTRFVDCNVQNSQADGIKVIAGSSDTIFERTHSQNNLGEGFLLENSGNVYFYGAEPFDGLWSINNRKNGILIRNSQNIHIGDKDKGVNIANNFEKGILIDGEATENVNITSCMIAKNNGVGIHVLNGKKIVIGGHEENARNYIELSHPHGILVQRNASEIAIINNLIGEPEDLETDFNNNGNYVGIQLEGIPNAMIQRNLINHNRNDAIVLKDGTTGALVYENDIKGNFGYGVKVDGVESIENIISGNYFRGNLGNAIWLTNGGNKMIGAPNVTGINWEAENISGTCDAPDGSRIEVYAHDWDAGQFRIVGTTRLYRGKFTASGLLEEGELVCALVIHPDGNTSIFGPSYLSETVSGGAKIPFVYTSALNGNRDILLKKSLSETPIQLTDHPAADYSPKFSPNANKILFVSERTGNPNLWVMDVDGAGLLQQTDHPAADYDPAWRNADQIVFVSERDGNPEIYVDSINVDDSVQSAASGPVRLTNDSAVDRYPAVSPDSNQIAFASDRNGTMDIWIMNTDGSSPVPLTDGNGDNTQPAWSPSGDTIAFVSDRDGNPDIYLIDVVTRAISRLVRNNAAEGEPAWNKEGNRILFSSNRDGTHEIYSQSTGMVSAKRMTFSLGDSEQPHAAPTSLPQNANIMAKQPRTDIAAVETKSIRPQIDGEPMLLSASSLTARAGENIACDIAISSANNLGNLAFELLYDQTIMQLTDISFADLMQSSLYAINPERYPSTLDSLRTNWIRSNGYTGNSTMFSLRFNIKSLSDSGAYKVSFGNIMAYDLALNPVPVQIRDGWITIIDDATNAKAWMLY